MYARENLGTDLCSAYANAFSTTLVDRGENAGADLCKMKNMKSERVCVALSSATGQGLSVDNGCRCRGKRIWIQSSDSLRAVFSSSHSGRNRRAEVYSSLPSRSVLKLKRPG